MLSRVRHEASARNLLRMFPVVGLIGARQVGKTTLARALIRGERQSVTFIDPEDPTDKATLADPKLALESLRGLVVLDEVQRKEGLFACCESSWTGPTTPRILSFWAVPDRNCSGRLPKRSRDASPTASFRFTREWKPSG